MPTVRREELIESVRAVLEASGFHASKPLAMRGISFDIVARRGDQLLIVKVLSNVDAFSKENAEELQALGEALSAKPVLVGERSGSGIIDESIVYSRFGIPIVSLGTLRDYLVDGLPPFIFAAPGGLYVKLDGDLLRKIREERKISLGTLAEIAGVSRRTIQMYESGMGAMIDATLRLEEFLDQQIALPVDMFSPIERSERKEKEPAAHPVKEAEGFGREVYDSLRGLGFTIVTVSRSPFEALSQDEKAMILTGLGVDDSKLRAKAEAVADISRVTQRSSVIFIERDRPSLRIDGTAIICRDELKRMRERCVLYDVVVSGGEAHEGDKD